LNPAAVLAIEIKQFIGSSVMTLVPTVIGQTGRAGTIRAAAQARGGPWNRESLLAALRDRNGGEAGTVAARLLDWREVHLPYFWWGTGKRDGSCFVGLSRNGRGNFPFSIWTYGRIEFQLQWMRQRARFDNQDLLLQWVARLNEIPSVSVTPQDVTRRPEMDVAAVRDPEAMQRFLSAMEWFGEQVGAAK
jgi:hypothetical protein